MIYYVAECGPLNTNVKPGVKQKPDNDANGVGMLGDSGFDF